MKKYSLETKLEAVNTYLNGAESLRVVAKRFNVSKTMLNRWVAKYQEHGLAAFQETYTKYSFGFKMDVINYINNMGASIEEATAKFNVSSSSVVTKWLSIYETQGTDALKRNKKERPSVAKEKKKHKNKEVSDKTLRAENERLHMENAYLKKLHALIQEKEQSQNKKKRK